MRPFITSAVFLAQQAFSQPLSASLPMNKTLDFSADKVSGQIKLADVGPLLERPLKVSPSLAKQISGKPTNCRTFLTAMSDLKPSDKWTEIELSRLDRQCGFLAAAQHLTTTLAPASMPWPISTSNAVTIAHALLPSLAKNRASQAESALEAEGRINLRIPPLKAAKDELDTYIDLEQISFGDFLHNGGRSLLVEASGAWWGSNFLYCAAGIVPYNHETKTFGPVTVIAQERRCG